MQQLPGIVAGMLQAVHQLHCSGLMHGDIKPSNFLMLEPLRMPVDSFGCKGKAFPSVRLADFGSCSLLDGELQVKACTYPFCPGEAFR